MIPWIQVYSNLLEHPKTYRLADELNLSSAFVDPNAIAAAMLVGLWTWASQNAYDGDLSSCGARAIANACKWKKKPETLLNALVSCRWIDEDMQLHDWAEYAVLYIEAEDNKKEKSRERSKRYRDKKHHACVTPPDEQNSVTRHACVTSPSRDGDAKITPLPDHTIPYQTSSNQNSLKTSTGKAEEDIKRARAHAREVVAVADGDEKLGRVLADYQGRILGTAAPASVVEALRHYCAVMDEAVIVDAFDVALTENKRHWSYIRGILDDRERNGVKDMAGVLRDRERHRQTRAEGGKKARDYGIAATPHASSEQIDRLDRMLAKMEADS